MSEYRVTDSSRQLHPTVQRNSSDTEQGGGTRPTTLETSQQAISKLAIHASPVIQTDDLPPPLTEEVTNRLPVLENYSEMEGSAESPANDDVRDLIIPPPCDANLATWPATLAKTFQFSIPRDLRPADDNQTNPASGYDTTDKPVSEIENTGSLPTSRLHEDREERPGGEAARPTTQS